MASIPYVGYLFNRLHNWYHSKVKHQCHTQGCSESHLLHTEVVDNSLPIEEWDLISIYEVEERFGIAVIEDLIGNPQLLRITQAPPEDEFVWFVNQQWMLKAEFRGRQFLSFGEIDTDATWHEIGTHE